MNKPACAPVGASTRWCSRSTWGKTIGGISRTESARLIVVLQAKVCDQLFPVQVAQRVLQLHGLNEQIMFRTESGSRHRRLKIETEPLLDSDAAELVAALRQVHKQRQVENNGCRQD